MRDQDERIKVDEAKGLPCPEENDISLLDLILVLLRHKWLIFWMVFMTGGAAAVITLNMTNIYRSEATITPREEEKGGSSLSLPSLGGLGSIVAGELGIGGGGTLEKLEVVLASRGLTLRVIEKYGLMPVVTDNGWLAAVSKKLTQAEKNPTVQDGLKKIKDEMLKINVDSAKNIVRIGFEHKDPSTAQKVVANYLKEASEMLREEVIRDAEENRRFFNEQLNRTSDALLKEKIYAMLAKEIEKETFARAQKYYSFQVLDPPIVPDSDKEVKPRRTLICLAAVILAFCVAVFFAFFVEFVQRIQSNNPGRYRELADGLKPWRIRRRD